MLLSTQSIPVLWTTSGSGFVATKNSEVQTVTVNTVNRPHNHFGAYTLKSSLIVQGTTSGLCREGTESATALCSVHTLLLLML